jgi:hypothetical protein
MPASNRSQRAAVGGALLRLAWLAACALAACGDDPLAPTSAQRAPAPEPTSAQRGELAEGGGAHAIVLAAADAESATEGAAAQDAAAGDRVHEDAVLLAITGAVVDSVTPVAGVRAALMPMGGTTHLLLTGRLPRGAAARAATVWTAAGAAATVAVEQAVGGGSLRQQPALRYEAALR